MVAAFFIKIPIALLIDILYIHVHFSPFFIISVH